MTELCATAISTLAVAVGAVNTNFFVEMSDEIIANDIPHPSGISFAIAKSSCPKDINHEISY